MTSQNGKIKRRAKGKDGVQMKPQEKKGKLRKDEVKEHQNIIRDKRERVGKNYKDNGDEW